MAQMPVLNRGKHRWNVYTKILPAYSYCVISPVLIQIDTFQTPSIQRPDTLQILSRHPLDTHKTPSKFQLPSFYGSKRYYDSGGWRGPIRWVAGPTYIL